MIKKHTGDIRSFLNTATLEAANASTGNAYAVTMIDAHKIYVNEKNLYGIRGIEEMANSMAISDNIPPLVVTPVENGKYKLISGERRLSAVLLREQRGEIENPKVPCFIREIQPIGPLSAEQAEMMLLILENTHRDKTPLEKLNEIKALEPMARTIYEDERAKGNLKGSFRSFFAESILNMSEASMKRLKALDRLIPDVKDALEDGRISQSTAVELSKKSEDVQKKFLERLVKGEAIDPIQETATTLAANSEDEQNYCLDSDENQTDAGEGSVDTDEEAQPNMTEDDESKIFPDELRQDGVKTEKGDADDHGDEMPPALSPKLAPEKKERAETPKATVRSCVTTINVDVPFPEDLSGDKAEREADTWMETILMDSVKIAEAKTAEARAEGATKIAALWDSRRAKAVLVLETVRE